MTGNFIRHVFFLILLSVSFAEATPIRIETDTLNPGQAIAIGSALFRGNATLDLSDGTFSVLTANTSSGQFSYGEFSISGGIVTNTTGSVTLTSATSIGFDPSKLAEVRIDPTQLNSVYAISFPAGVDTWRGSAHTYFLPSGHFSIQTLTGTEIGAFDVSGTAISTVSGALIRNTTGVDFDLSKLASVSINSLQLGPSYAVSFPEMNLLWRGSSYVFPLPSGRYSLAIANGNLIGTFDISGTVITQVSGALSISSSGVDFDLSKLTMVSIDPTSLSSNVDQYIYFPEVLADWRGSIQSFPVPDGNYSIKTSTQVNYGTFRVQNHAVTSLTGALVSNSSGLISFDRCRLNLVQITPQPNVTWFLGATQNGSSGGAEIAVPDGTYSIVIDSGINSEFAVNSQSISMSALPSISNPLISLSVKACHTVLPSAQIGGPYFSTVGVPINFDGSASSISDGSSLTYSWNFGDGTTGSGRQVVHTYSALGTYSAILTVTSTSGLSSSQSSDVLIGTAGDLVGSISNFIQGRVTSGAIAPADAQILLNDLSNIQTLIASRSFGGGFGGGGGGSSGGGSSGGGSSNWGGGDWGLNSLGSQADAAINQQISAAITQFATDARNLSVDGRISAADALRMIKFAVQLYSAISGDPRAILDIISQIVDILHTSGIISENDYNNLSIGLQAVSAYFAAGDPTTAMQRLLQINAVINNLASAGIIPPEIATYINQGIDILNGLFGRGSFYSFATIIKAKLMDLYQAKSITYGAFNSIVNKIERASSYLAAGNKLKGLEQLRLAQKELLNIVKIPEADKKPISDLIDIMLALI